MSNASQGAFEDSAARRGRLIGGVERRIALAFSGFLLLLAVVLSGLGGLGHLRDVERERAIFAGVIARTLDRSINAVNFGGVYQVRAFVKETAEASKPIAYLYIVDPNGRFLAHSDEALNGQPVPEGWTIVDDAYLTSQRRHEERSVTEIAMPLRGGFNRALMGTVYVGIYVDSPRELLIKGARRTAVIFAGVVLLGLPLVFFLSLRLAEPIRRLAGILQGILARAPVMIAIFDEEGNLEESSAQLQATLDTGGFDPLLDLRSLATPRAGPAEVVITQAEGKRTWSVILFPLDRGHCLIARDITEEKLLAREHSQLAAAVAAADDQVLITTTRGRITYVNPAFTRITGFERDEALGRTPRILKSDHNPRELYEGLWATITEGLTWRGRVVNRKKTGDLYQCDLVVSPIHSGGVLTNFVAIGRDRTRELKLEEQLLHAQRMDAVGRLAGGIAHDFNNLLSVINGHTELLLLTPDLSAELQKDIGVIAGAGRRAAELTQQLLAFSRRQPRNLESLDLGGLVLDLVDMISSILGHDIHFEYKLGAQSGWFIRGDRGQLEQVILNLCINARDAMPDGGRLLIDVEHRRFDDSDVEAPPGEYAVLSISDTGEGIPPEIRDKIFEPFFTTKPTGEGTGLGLSMVHGVLKQSGGFIWVYSEPKVGTTFKLVFPRTKRAPTASQTMMPKLQALPTGTERVLIVEDQEPVRRTIAKILKQAGYAIEEAEHGAEALALLEGGSAPALVLSDLVMPVMGGLELAKEINRRYPNIRVIFMSGYSAHVAENSDALGEVPLIRKPPTVRELREKIRLALDQPSSA